MSLVFRPLAVIAATVTAAVTLASTVPAADEIAAGVIAAGGPRPLGLVAFVEGPVWHPSGNVYFTDVENNRIMRFDRRGQMHVFRAPSGRANGLEFDREGRLVACEGAGEGGNRRITRTELDGTITVLADRWVEPGRPPRRFNSPNDLVIDAEGRIYFTDPRYGPRHDLEILDDRGQPIEGVYVIDRGERDGDRRVRRVIAGEVQRPNGIGLSPDGRWLYVVDNQNSTPTGNRKVWRFDRAADGSVDRKSAQAIVDFGDGRGGDGLSVDAEGRIYVAAGLNLANPPLESDRHKAGIYVFTPEGKRLAFLPIAEDMITNCCFGGPDGKTLFVTAGHRLWAVPVNTPGHFNRAPRRPAD